MTEVSLGQGVSSGRVVQLKVEAVQMPRTMAQILKFEGPFRFLVARALDDDNQHAGTTGDVDHRAKVSPHLAVRYHSPGVPAPYDERLPENVRLAIQQYPKLYQSMFVDNIIFKTRPKGE